MAIALQRPDTISNSTHVEMWDDIIRISRVTDILRNNLIEGTHHFTPLAKAVCLSFGVDLDQPSKLPAWLRRYSSVVLKEYLLGTHSFRTVRFGANPALMTFQYGHNVQYRHCIEFINAMVAGCTLYVQGTAERPMQPPMSWSGISTWFSAVGADQLRGPRS